MKIIMVVKQLSVFVENKPGRLSDITKTLADNNVDIRALSIADTTNFGILRLIVSDPDLSEKVLHEAGYTVSQTEVIAVGLQDKPGGLAKAMEALFKNGITVEYMYAFISRDVQSAYVILRVEDNEAASAVLEKSGVSLLSSKEIYDM